ncbi:hypothetical protein H5410_051882 [Solanum commersonii]|uniref:MADS-box domain-containing protein n=1 Tax=Solanum commersonii TaxID=4109 RepID=A0A9J5X0Q2_SOLCO|nr:hypothetical protein H5410_051882 [Solanum commersonii]
MAKKPGMGRQRIKIVKIEVKNHLQVTFSKRRSGLFKKASELCMLCGVEIAIIIFSPARKAYSFGHTNVESIIDRVLSRNPHLISNNPPHLFESHNKHDVNVCELNLQLTQILDEVEKSSSGGGDVSGGCYLQQEAGETLDERQSWNYGSVEGEEEKKEEGHVQENQKEIDNNGSFEGENLLEFDGTERCLVGENRTTLFDMRAFPFIYSSLLRGLFTFDATPLSDSLKLHYFGESDMYPLAFLRVQAT